MSRKEILKLKLSEPVRYDGKEITELDLSGYEMLTLKDLTEIYAAYEAFGGGSVIMQESDLRSAQCAAARVAGLPVEALDQLRARDAVRLKNMTYRFFYM